MMKRTAERNQRADHIVEMTLLSDIKRIAVVRAQAHETRRVLVENFRKRMKILRHRSLADQDRHALPQLLPRLVGGRGFVVGANSRGKIAVKIMTAQQRRVAINVPVLERRELVQHRLFSGENTWKVHELGQADDLGVIAKRKQVRCDQMGAGCFELGRRHAG